MLKQRFALQKLDLRFYVGFRRSVVASLRWGLFVPENLCLEFPEKCARGKIGVWIKLIKMPQQARDKETKQRLAVAVRICHGPQLSYARRT